MLNRFLKLAPQRYQSIHRVQKMRYLDRSQYYFSMQSNKKHKIGVAIDIDGTLILKDRIISGAKQALQKLIQLDIPYLLLTNNISRSQQFKAAELNKIFNLSKPILDTQVILSYTPMKPKFQTFGEGIVLVIGRQVRLKDVLPLPFIKKYITVEEYISLFPETVPLSNRLELKNRDVVRQQLVKRLGVQTFDKHSLKIASVLLLTVPNHWEQNYQVVIDLLSTDNGTVSTKKQFKYVENHIPVIAAYNDIAHISYYHNLPRILMKPFTQGLKSVFKTVYHHDLKIQLYGKPQLSVFQFSKKQLESVYGSIDKMVMIGDNQGSDIIGAYNSSWDSILVKTGVTQYDSQFATVNAENILVGIQQYLKQQPL